jgi:ornithine cyclodeaminase/alanine dehydrogenase-like protein (mu-crystallin family)
VRIVTAEEIDRVLTYSALIEALKDAFRGELEAPARHHHTVPHPGADATLLLMPAWSAASASSGERFLGCKLVTVFPENVSAGKPSVYGSYFLTSGSTGEPLAILEGRALTAWRTAAASALAASFLAREDASHLVMVGAGALAPHLVRAHATVRPIQRVTLWNRTRHRAVGTAFGLAASGIEIEVVDDLEPAVRDADIVSCATLSATPLIDGNWLKKGAHVDLVGGFTPKMREADDRAIKRARVFVDTYAGALKEAGDIVQPIRRKVLGKDDIAGELAELCRGKAKGRKTENEITLFKSVGAAVEDLAAAMLVWRGLGS